MQHETESHREALGAAAAASKTQLLTERVVRGQRFHFRTLSHIMLRLTLCLHAATFRERGGREQGRSIDYIQSSFKASYQMCFSSDDSLLILVIS